MRIAVLHDWDPPYEYELVWQDGLAAALAELRKRGHDVQIFTVGAETVIHNPLHDIVMTPDPVGAITRWEPEVILNWADMTRPHTRPLFDTLHKPMAVCFAGGDVNGENMPFFSHIFVESSVYQKQLKEEIPCTIAFGTNTSLFTPDPPADKQWDTIFPATFAAWKRHYLYAEAVEKTGIRALAVGHQYPDHEQECWQDCLKRGVEVMPYKDAVTLRGLYAASNVGVITSSSAGGSQRTILEMMAMNMPVVITDSDKFSDYLGDVDSVVEAEPDPQSIREAIYLADGLIGDIQSRLHVLARWSEFAYADRLEEGLRSIL